MRACILAGGRGTRLAPLTFVLPKPLVPVGDRPILDIIVHQLAYYGVRDITLCLGHLGELIEAYYSSGSHQPSGVNLNFIKEKEPLGTAGALGTLPKIHDSLLVVNGDILTSLNYRQMVDYHKAQKNVLTIAVHELHHSIEFGVLELDRNDTVIAYQEKPQQVYLIGMGIYVYEPSALNFIKAGTAMDVPELVKGLLHANLKVGGYRTDASWYDIGNPQDYREASEIFDSNPAAFMPSEPH